MLQLPRIHLLVFLLVFVVPESRSSVNRMFDEMKYIVAAYDAEVAEDDAFARSVFYIIQGKHAESVRVSGDNSLFHERFLVSLQPYIPPAVISDSQKIYRGNITFVAAENCEGLWTTLTNQKLWSAVRYYCLVNNATLGSVYAMFEGTEIFKDAEVAIFVVNQYDRGLWIAPPESKLETMQVPPTGYWRGVEEAKHVKTEIRFTTGNCDIHGTVNGNVSGLDPYNPDNFGGVDWRIFKRIASIMNWTMVYVHTTKEQYLGEYNGTWKGGMLGSLVDDTADVAFCGIWIDWRKLSDGIQMSVPMTRVCIQYIVPRPVIARHNKPIAKCFTPTVYALMISTVIATSFTLYFMNANDKYFVPSSDKGYRGWMYCFMVVLGILFQGNYPPQSADMGSSRRIILLYVSCDYYKTMSFTFKNRWSILSMLLACSFSSQLVSNFSHPRYTSKPRSVEELVDFGYSGPYYGDGAFPWSGVFNREVSYSREWLNRAYAVPDFDKFVEILRTKPQQASIGIMYEKSTFIPGSKMPRPIPAEVLAGYETMDECVGEIYEAFAVRQGSRFYQKINKYLTYFKQYGMMKKIYSQAVQDLADEQPALRNLTVKVSEGLKPLSVTQLAGVFYVHQMGMTASLLVFVCEIIFHRRQDSEGNRLQSWRGCI